MNSIFVRGLGIALCAFAISSSASSAEKIRFACGIEAARGGALTLRNVAQTPRAGMWLGVTLHPANGAADSRPILETFPLKMGHVITDIDIDPRITNGTFEAALWDRNEAGKLVGIEAYCWGHVGN
jgi:hypothetical protein